METVKSKIFQDILKKNRNRFNSTFKMAQQFNMQLEDQKFLKYLCEVIDPILIKHEKEGRDFLENIVITLYDQVLNLCGKGFLGNKGKYPYFEDSLYNLIDNYSHILIKNPDSFIPEISNAIYNLSEEVDSNIYKWTGILINLKNEINTIKDFRNISFVIAWICGLATYRDRAIEISLQLDYEIIYNIFEIETTKMDKNKASSMLNEMKRNPWINPESFMKDEQDKPVVKILGGFSGYGSIFKSIPETSFSEIGFIVKDNEKSYLLVADFFGSVFVPIDSKGIKKVSNNSRYTIDNNGKISYHNNKFRLKESSQPVKSQASNENTLCYTSPNSYKIFVVGAGRLGNA